MTTTPRLVKSLTQVNTADAPAAPGGTDIQSDGQIGPLLDGGYVVVWTDGSRTHNPGGSAIVGQRYDILGNKVGGEVKISGFVNGNQFNPAVTTLSNGNITAAWEDQFSGDSDLYVTIVNPSLGTLRTDFIDVGLAQTFDPSVTALAGGAYAISYTLQNSVNDRDIVARIVSPTGDVGAQFDVDNAPGLRNFSEVATLSNGNFVVVYQSGPTFVDIFYRIFTPAGTSVIGPASVPGAFDFGPETDPHVAALRDGGFVVVWTDPDSRAPNFVNDIRASIISNTGTSIADNILVNTIDVGNQNEANVVALADGGFLVTWEDDNANLVRAQRFDAAANKIGTEFTVKNGISDGFSGDNPEAALLSDGGRIAYALGDASTGDLDVTTSIWRARDVSHDFDGDGKSGVLWRHDSGQVYFWEMDGLGIKAEGSVAHAPVPTDWHIQGAGDFDGDGNNDVLWRHDSGQVYFWEMDGLGIKAEGAAAHAPVPNEWHIQGVGDFNADGKSDVLWRHDSGPVYIWEMDGLGTKAEGGVAHAAVPTDWHIQGIGDFDGDGKSDILWRHDSGQVYIWEMNGLQVKAEGTVVHAPVGNDWHVEDIGDYNNDGKSGDILWRHDSGQVYTWEINGLGITAEGGAPHAPVPSDWHIFSQHNFV
jgi:hypothetical protein